MPAWVEALGEVLPQSRRQRCIVHFYRNIMAQVPSNRPKEVLTMLKAVHAQEDRKEAQAKARIVAHKLTDMKLRKAAELVERSIHETLQYYESHRNIGVGYGRTTLERIIREVRRWTKVVGCFPDGNSALMLVAGRLRHVAGPKWGTRRYLDMERLRAIETTTDTAAEAS